jgi:hypothetical protein
MHINQLTESIIQAPLGVLDDLARLVWDNLASGSLTDSEAQALAEAIQGRREEARTKAPSESASEASGRPAMPSPRAWTYFPPKRPQRSPDRARSIERRRTLASCGPLPPALAAKFTTGELSVLWIVSEEVAAKGTCSLSLPELAARAGVGLTKARLALRIAQDLGLLTITERRVPYRPNLSNLIRIVSPAWKAWIAHRKPRKPTPRPSLTTPTPKPTIAPTVAIGSTFAKPTESNRFSG